MSSHSHRRALRGWLLAASLLAPAAFAQAADLSFEHAVELALQQAPALQAARERQYAAQQSASAAGRLPDPELLLGVDNLMLQGPQRFRFDGDPMTMRRLGLMQRFPNQGKRESQRMGAAALIAERASALQAAARQVLNATATAWIALHRLDAQFARLQALRQEAQLRERAALAQLGGGGDSSDAVLLARQEHALIEQRVDELQAERLQWRAQLRRYLGEVAGRPLSGDVPALAADAGALRAQLSQHPLLQGLLAERDRLAAEVAMARAEQRPDWSLELGYGDRSAHFGDMAMLQLRVDLPIFQGARQQPRLAGKLSERSAIDDAIEAAGRELSAELDTLLAEHARAERAEQRLQTILLPLASQRVDLQQARWESGGGSLEAVLAARRDRIELELEALARRGERQTLAARLHYGFAALPPIEGITP